MLSSTERSERVTDRVAARMCRVVPGMIGLWVETGAWPMPSARRGSRDVRALGGGGLARDGRLAGRGSVPRRHQETEHPLDGSHIVTASGDGTAKVWDARTGTEVLSLKGHGDMVMSASFSPDRSRIVTASADGTARVWDARPFMATGTQWTEGREQGTGTGQEEDLHSETFRRDSAGANPTR